MRSGEVRRARSVAARGSRPVGLALPHVVSGLLTRGDFRELAKREGFERVVVRVLVFVNMDPVLEAAAEDVAEELAGVLRGRSTRLGLDGEVAVVDGERYLQRRVREDDVVQDAKRGVGRRPARVERRGERDERPEHLREEMNISVSTDARAEPYAACAGAGRGPERDEGRPPVRAHRVRDELT